MSDPGPLKASPQGSPQFHLQMALYPSSSTEENKDSPTLLFLKALQVYLWRGNSSAQIIRVPLETSQQIMKNSLGACSRGPGGGDADGG